MYVLVHAQRQVRLIGVIGFGHVILNKKNNCPR
jgi:hypothetical protein